MKNIHLTFDDGPHATWTPVVLEVLAAHRIKATFFVIGNRVERHASIVRNILGGGHRIGNHTYSHQRLTALPQAAVAEEVLKTEAALEPYQSPDRIVRPPYGAHDAQVDQTLAHLGYRSVLWSVDTEDWKRKPDAWAAFGLEQIARRTDSVVLMHDIHETTARNLDRFIKGIRAMDEVRFEDPHTLDAPKPGSGGQYYTVVQGDTLLKIALRFYGSTDQYMVIFEANRAQLDSPEKVRVGQVLFIPELVQSKGTYYTVLPGDTLSKLSRQFYGTSSKYLLIFEANKDVLQTPDKVYPGQVLFIPNPA